MTSEDEMRGRPEDDDVIDGRTLEELSDYLAAGRTPVDPGIEGSAESLLYLSALERLRQRSWAALTQEADAEHERDQTWIGSLLQTIREEVRSGRDIPIDHPDPRLRLTITEAAVQGLVRHAADDVPDALIGRSTLEGDVSQPRAPVRVVVTVAVLYGRPLADIARDVRAGIASTLATHTELTVERIDVVVDDVYTERLRE